MASELSWLSTTECEANETIQHNTIMVNAFVAVICELKLNRYPYAKSAW